MNNILDFMLLNEKMLYFSLFFVLLAGYMVFRVLKLDTLFIVALFIAIKVTVHNYLDEYLDKKSVLKEIKESHRVSTTILTSLLISLPAILIAKYIGVQHIHY